MTTIKTGLGPVTGRKQRDVSVFLGIPFAAPPTGMRRWMPPEPADPWPDGLDATSHTNRCLQPPYMEALAGRDIPGELSEDCLYLNIYTPGSDGKKRPVMFWIHGGAYMQGSANEYDGTTLAEENDVVVVAINYRLGIFGFLDLSSFGPEYKGSASLGFQDQIAALAWVRDNITDYGGDPDNVMIFGESAGGGSVLALLAAPQAKGLFHKAIALSPGEIVGPPQDQFPVISGHLGLDDGEVLERLGNLSSEDVFNIQLQGAYNTNAAVDGTIITEQPSLAIKASGADGVPLVIGCCKDEGTFLADAIPPEGMEAAIFAFGVLVGNGDAGKYFELLGAEFPTIEPREQMVRIWYDFFRSSVLRCAEASTAAGSWVYNFDVPTDNLLGVTHASDIAFAFNSFKDSKFAFAFHDGKVAANREVAEIWSRTFATFARTGDPNGAGLPTWPKYDPVNRSCLILDHDPWVAQDPDGEALRAAYGMK